MNPLLSPWPGPFGGVPPWDHMRPEHFPSAFEAAMAEELEEIESIAANPDEPTFDNTFAAMERAGSALRRITPMFSVACESVTIPEYQKLEREWQPKLHKHSDSIVFNPALFKRIESVYLGLPSTLDPDQIRLVTRVYEKFVRRGAKLDTAGKARLSAINQQLAACFAEFRAKVLADENSWTLLKNEEDLAGLPSSLVATLHAAAEERGLPGQWAIVNTRSIVDPFLMFSTRRNLREAVWKKFKSRGDNGDANDTKSVISVIVRLRSERATLLGFATHAHWRMLDTMARDPAAARQFLLKIWPVAVAGVRRDVADMQAIADREGNGTAIEPWDYLFYAEKVRKAKYDLDQSELKPYFELNNMVAAALWSAERRFDITFREITGTVPVFHPEMRVWEVTDAGAGRHRALFYHDNFARPGKRSGAWASDWRIQSSLGTPVTAIASNNNNFVKGGPGEPVLISVSDAETLFHELGHALHLILQDVRYRGLSSTPRDYVELPSQLNERWLFTREVLDRFARHYRTGQPIPQSLVDRIEQSAKFNQGYTTVEYLAAAIVDLDLHMRPEGVDDMAAFEREALARIGDMPKEIALRHRLPHFDHLFGSDGYSAGYYSYLWSDVMAADAWRAFVESGPWNPTTNQRLRACILSDGNSIDRAEAYRRFRGRDPDVQALLESRGFVPAAAGR
ncbi:MAG TPA: M3 family metallopeptidase [Vicinamibacterales bacterium]|nr:M3 family metallopeptidase [Vicinamibacterales bacterium]